MQILIDISNEEYEKIKENDCGLFNGRIYQMIRNGTPFNSVIEDIKAEISYVGAHSDYGIQCVYATAIEIIDKHISGKGEK